MNMTYVYVHLNLFLFCFVLLYLFIALFSISSETVRLWSVCTEKTATNGG